MTGLTNDDPRVTNPVYKQYYHVQYNDTLRPLEVASVSFPASADTFRYLVLQNQFDYNDAICLTEVKVYLRGKRLRFGEFLADIIVRYINLFIYLLTFAFLYQIIGRPTMIVTITTAITVIQY